MNIKFKKNTENFLKIILKNALKQNLRVFFVGGLVRDKLLNIPIKDIDLLLVGNAIEFSKTLPDEIKIKSIHNDFCTTKLSYQNTEIDVASSRRESYPYSGCLPVIEQIGVEINKDVLRRDFSVNSLYIELKLIDNVIKYELIDLINGVNDIKNKTLKVLHNKSYIDDPTRIFRGLGFKYRFNFDFSKKDKILINEYLNKIDYLNMSLDRNKKVARQILSLEYQDEIFKELIESKYYKIINPDNLDINFDLTKEIINIFNLNTKQKTDFYLNLILNEEFLQINFKHKVDIVKILSKFSIEKLAYYYYKTKDNNVLFYLKNRDIKPIICGDNLLKLGYSQGKLLGKILENLYIEKIENPSKFKEKKDEINWIKQNYPIV